METGIYVRREGQGDQRDLQWKAREQAGEGGVSNIKKTKEKKVDFLLRGEALCIL